MPAVLSSTAHVPRPRAVPRRPSPGWPPTSACWPRWPTGPSRTVSSEELAAAAGRELGQAAQGPVLPRLVRHPRRRLRRRHPDRADLAHPRAHRAPLASPSSASATSARRWPATRVRLPRLPHRRAARRRPGPGRHDDPRPGRARHRRARRDRAPSSSITIAVLAVPGRRRAGGLRPARRGRRHQHPELRPGRAVGARRTSTCARSTSPPSCRSCPSTRTARPPAARLADEARRDEPS